MYDRLKDFCLVKEATGFTEKEYRDYADTMRPIDVYARPIAAVANIPVTDSLISRYVFHQPSYFSRNTILGGAAISGGLSGYALYNMYKKDPDASLTNLDWYVGKTPMQKRYYKENPLPVRKFLHDKFGLFKDEFED